MKPPPAYVPRGLRRIEAARYVGISPTTFDEWVAAGFMPQPIRVGGVVVFDSRAIDVAFDALGGEAREGPNPWD